MLGSQRPGTNADELKLTLTPTPLGDQGCALGKGDALAEVFATPKDPSLVERSNILRGFEVLASKLLDDQGYARLAEVRQIIPKPTPSAIETRSEPELVSLSRFGVQPWETLFLKVKHEDSGLIIEPRTGGFMFAISGFWVNTFGTYGGNLRFVDGFSRLEPLSLLRQVDNVTLQNGEYVASSGAGFEVIFSRPGTLSDLAIQLRQTSGDKLALGLPHR